MTLCPRSEILGPLGNFLRVEVSEVRPGHPKPFAPGRGLRDPEIGYLLCNLQSCISILR